MNGRLKGLIFFSLACSALIIGIAVAIAVFAVLNEGLSRRYPEYRYSEYVRREAGQNFSERSGAQLFEAENARLYNGCTVEDNKIASGGLVVENIDEGAFLQFRIPSATGCRVKAVVSLAYLSSDGRETAAENLFSLRLNGRRISMRRAQIKPSFNRFHLQENVLCELDLKNTENVLEMDCIASAFSVDYLVLIPYETRTQTETVIGVSSCPFFSQQAQQRLEVEQGEREGCIAVNYSGASEDYYIRYDTKGVCSQLYFDSDAACLSNLSVAVNNHGAGNRAPTVCDIYVNGEQLNLNSVRFPLISDINLFQEVALGEVSLRAGRNVITVVSVSGNFFLDYFTLNTDINYSNDMVSQRYEAEKATLMYGCFSEMGDNTSGGAYVCNNVVDSCVRFTLRSKSVGREFLTIRMEYRGEKTSWDEVLSLTVNGESVPCSLPVGALYGEGYADIPFGQISLNTGINQIIVKSLAGEYNLDYITLTGSVWEAEEGECRLEAEKSVLSGGCKDEWNVEASAGKNVGFNVSDSSVSFSLYVERGGDAKLYLSLSCILPSDGKMSDLLAVYVNGKALDVYDVMFIATGKWTVFTENFTGDIRLEEGINFISVRSKGGNYNLDYIRLQAEA